MFVRENNPQLSKESPQESEGTTPRAHTEQGPHKILGISFASIVEGN